jgi:trehalose-6-phosphatase
LYDPSVNYDESCAHEYGGYKSNDVCEITLNHNIVASSEDLTDSKKRSTVSIHSSSSSSLSKIRYNSEDAPLNYDDTESESDDNDDDDDGFKRSKSSDDKRIFVKKLTSVKGRQVGLLIGPFGILHFLLFYFSRMSVLGQHITQIREQTGAKIHLTNDDNEPSVIKGTKSQINLALRLIRECLQTQKPIPRTTYKGGRRR